MKKWFLSFLTMVLVITMMFSDVVIRKVEAASGNTSKTFGESTSQNQTHSISIPKLKSVSSVSVNTGNVTYSVSGETITFNLSNGSPSRSVQTGGSPAETKTVTVPGGSYTAHTGPICYGPGNYESAPRSMAYDSDGFKGTLGLRFGDLVYSHSLQCPGMPDDPKTNVDVHNVQAFYTGDVSKPDTRTYEHYYQYTVSVNYIFNTNPTINLTAPLDSQSFGMAYHIPVTGTILDEDVGDKLFVKYTVDNGTTNTLYTVDATGANQSFTKEIPLSALSRGDHNLKIWVEDNNGGQSQQLTRKFTVLSSNANLISFENDYSGSYVMRPSFKKETTGYLLDVENEVEGISVTPVLEENWSSLKVNGVEHTSGTKSSLIPLKLGNNDIKVDVTAEDGITKKNYLLRVTRFASKNVALSKLEISEGTLSPSFNSKVFSYSADVSFDTTSITVSPATDDPQASITVNNTTVKSGATSKSIPLDVGSNSIGIRVTAPDGLTTQSTELTIVRAKNGNSKLSSLKPSSGGLAPMFSPDHLQYTLDVPYDVKEISFTPNSSDSAAVIRINGNYVMSGEESSTITLQNGKNNVVVSVTAQDGSQREYLIEVNRAASNNTLLKDVSFTDVNMRPAFASETLSYTGTVLANTSTTTVKAVSEDPNAVIKINGKVVESGENMMLPLTVGTNVVTINVKAPGGEERTYGFTITRPGSSNALLADIWLSDGKMAPAFDPTVNDYSVQVKNDVKYVRLTAVSDDNNSKIQINGDVYGSGETTAPIVISSGKTIIPVKVTAGNGVTTNTYTITVNRDLSNNADLTDLKLSVGALSPSLQAGRYSYQVDVPYNTTSISVMPSAEQGAKITVNGKVVQSGGYSTSIGLSTGSNAVKISVTSPDKSVTNTYELTVIRQSGGGTGPIPGFMVSPIDTQLIAMFQNPTKDLVTGELWRNGLKEATVTSRSNTIVFGSNGHRISVQKGEVYTVKISFRTSGVTAEETVTAIGSPDVKATPVSGLKLLENTSTLAKLQWSAPSDKTPATDYTVTIYNETTGKRVQSVKVKDEYFDFRKVGGADQRYRYEVQRLDVHRKPSDAVVIVE
ncbi:cadherin-like beta sandwich domain-containing protein [Brevibacillus reuszeri]|uniref:cadherin-like beta sandwich domain-containing protein n=1 Tax=Brevibacillus reuszeri TaxID=54915 RepID=UPI001F3124E5|nr:cadherin-like beta sandwich domain-containing protein [Brevibacillus reuszeri]